MKNENDRLRDAIAQGLKEIDSVHNQPMPQGPYLAPVVDDDMWLATVVICLTDAYTGDIEAAITVVDTNRTPCLHAHRLGFEPWEVAQYIAMKTGAEPTS